MGSWGFGPFDNDTACDWSYDLEESSNLSFIDETLEKVVSVGSEYLEASDAEEAIAAAEVIARMKGQWGERNAYTETVDNWVETQRITPAKEMIEKSLSAIDRITGDESELLELWRETSDFEKWSEVLEDLKKRLRT